MSKGCDFSLCNKSNFELRTLFCSLTYNWTLREVLKVVQIKGVFTSRKLNSAGKSENGPQLKVAS